jgi:hypothetical protein
MVRPMEVIEEGCRYQLKAFAALSKIESSISGKKYLDKLGFMGVTYRYQVGLQYLNIYRSREYEIYGIVLFKSILDNSSIEIILCYNGECIFGSTIASLLLEETASHVMTVFSR